MRKPRHAGSEFLEGAPPYVLEVRDAGPKYNDRYAVFFGWPIWQPEMGRTLPCLVFNGSPASPNAGYSQWEEMEARYVGKKIAWNDLSEDLRRHVIARANHPEKIIVVTLDHDPEHGWLLINEDGVGGVGPDFLTKKAALAWAKANNVVILREDPPKGSRPISATLSYHQRAGSPYATWNLLDGNGVSLGDAPNGDGFPTKKDARQYAAERNITILREQP